MIKGFKILTSSETHEGLLDYREKGALRGVYLGFPMLNEFYTMSLPGCTEWTGYPGSGKSEMLLELLLNTSLFYGWKHLLYVPDVGDKNEVIAILIHKITGKTFDKRYKNFISEQEVSRHLDWVLAHFKIMVQEDLKSKISPIELWDFAVEYSKTIDGGIQTVTIDSWKDMKHDRNLRDDQYLEDVLSYRNSLSETHKIHIHIVIHPRSTEPNAQGKMPIPKPRHQKGGSEWANSGKVQITMHREDGTTNEVLFIVTKAKPKSVAKVGQTTIYYNPTKSVFYERNGGVDVYANKNYIRPIGLQVNDDMMLVESERASVITSSSTEDFSSEIPF